MGNGFWVHLLFAKNLPLGNYRADSEPYSGTYNRSQLLDLNSASISVGHGIGKHLRTLHPDKFHAQSQRVSWRPMWV